jgi:hypothetical protein
MENSGVRLKTNEWGESFFPICSYIDYFSRIACFVFFSKQYRKYTNKHFGYIFLKLVKSIIGFLNPTFSVIAVTKSDLLGRILLCANSTRTARDGRRCAGPPASPSLPATRTLRRPRLRVQL